MSFVEPHVKGQKNKLVCRTSYGLPGTGMAGDISDRILKDFVRRHD